MHRLPERLAAVVEISRRADGQLPDERIAAAYRCSRENAVLLVLNGVTSTEVDRVLDPVVAASGLDMYGVVYASLSSEDQIMDAAIKASGVFATTEQFRIRLSERGIQFSDSERLLATQGGPSSPAEAQSC